MNNSGKKGFGGLSSLVSDIESTLAEVSTAQPEQTGSKAERGAGTTTAPLKGELPSAGEDAGGASSPTPAKEKTGSVAGWYVAILAIALIFVFSKLIEDRDAQVAAKAPVEDAVRAETAVPAPPPAHTRPTPVPAVVETAPPKPAVLPPVQTRPSEVKPPVGSNNVLSVAEIRYCEAEKIRLDTGEKVTDRYSQAAIRTFNAAVTDFNSRCGSFRYHGNDVLTARSDISQYRGEIEIEAMVKFRSTPPESVPNVQPSNVYSRPYGNSRYDTASPSSTYGNASTRTPRYGVTADDDEEEEKEE
ncbi:hypothetical protein D9X30_2955 (plasmid) [Cupriavidus sp. U2]|uniref:hypothetical protein n=1 Tax=Cupriavidus sp. U2 TaxID=2920269 RepID=UPI00129DD48E|nr:hypothetical protein [Cupriavidus sp. U2]KAI3592070.1 hypothetical protein D9X30_2955 [Cupriavidus sp. U2]